MTKISIILPIYNVEKYLAKCIDSVINQTLKDIEIILATDGPENCDRICNEYAAKDSRIKIILHPGSYGKACNQAMQLASGEYIGFVETDDWCDKTMFEKLYKLAKKNHADVCKCGFYNAYDNIHKNSSVLFLPQNTCFNISEYPELLTFQPSIWSAIYKNKFLKDNKITMIEDRMSFIDAPFHIITLLKANKICSLAEALYFYYKDNPNQSVQNEKASFDGLNAEKWLYNHYPLPFNNDKKLSSYCFKATICHLHWDYCRLKSPAYKQDFLTQTKELLQKIKLSKLNLKILDPHLIDFCHMVLPKSQYFKNKNKHFLENIFYMKNKNNHKVINLLGLKLKLKRKLKRK